MRHYRIWRLGVALLLPIGIIMMERGTGKLHAMHDGTDEFTVMGEKETAEAKRSTAIADQVLEGYFATNAVIAVEPEKRIVIQEIQDPIKPLVSKKLLFRGGSKLLGGILAPIKGSWQEVLPEEARSSEDWVLLGCAQTDDMEEVFQEGSEAEVHIILSDAAIAEAMNYTSFGWKHLAPMQNMLRLADIKQNDKRNTCYILATAAAYLCSEPGRQALTSIFRVLTGQERVLVGLYDSAVKKTVNINVPLSRITHDGEDLFSFSSTGAAWPAMMEKAFYGINLAIARKLKEGGYDPDIYDDVRSLLNHALDETGAVRLDFADLTTVLERLPTVSLPGVEQMADPIKIKLGGRGRNGFPSISEKDKRQIEINLAKGVPVIAGTRKMEGESSLFEKVAAATNAVVKGTPTGHAVAVLRVTTASRKNEEKKGLLVFDPYGEAVGSTPVDRIANKDIPFREIPGSPIHFIPWDKVSEEFEEIAIAKGSLKMKSSAPSF